MMLLVLLLVFLGLNALVWRRGFDSRDGRDWAPHRCPGAW
jgi:hypothetical protein